VVEGGGVYMMWWRVVEGGGV